MLSRLNVWTNPINPLTSRLKWLRFPHQPPRTIRELSFKQQSNTSHSQLATPEVCSNSPLLKALSTLACCMVNPSHHNLKVLSESNQENPKVSSSRTLSTRNKTLWLPSTTKTSLCNPSLHKESILESLLVSKSNSKVKLTCLRLVG